MLDFSNCPLYDSYMKGVVKEACSECEYGFLSYVLET